MDPKVSVIIPFYNCSYVDQAIESALKQTYANIEIILVDDGSTIYTEKIAPYLSKIRYIKKENGGTATALNRGIEEASGEYIAWLSSDDYFLPEKVSKQISFMLTHNADASFTNFDCINQYNKTVGYWTCPRFSNEKEIYQSFLKCNVINGCTVIMKKSLFYQIGYFDAHFRYTHDYEMWFRLLVNGHRIYYLDEVLTKFRTHEQAGTRKYHPQMREEMMEIERQYRPRLIEFIKHLK